MKAVRLPLLCLLFLVSTSLTAFSREEDGSLILLLQAPAPPSQEQEPSFVDFEKSEISLMAGAALSSPDFEADMSLCGGVLWHAPAPGMGDSLGVFAEGFWTNMERDIATLAHPSGGITLVGGGVDYTVHRDWDTFVVGQLGLLYANYCGISDTNSGAGIFAGLNGGVRLGKGFWFTYNPQFLTALVRSQSGEVAWHFFNFFGFLFEF